MKPLTSSFTSTTLLDKKSFNKILFGFNQARIVTYNATAESIIRLFDEWGYSTITIIIGDSLSARQSVKNEMATKPDALEKLAEKLANGSLTIFTASGKPIHSKIYLLSKPDGCRVVHTSANLSETVVAGRQINQSLHADMDESHPDWIGHLELFDFYQSKSEPFLDDLAKLLKSKHDQDISLVSRQWLNGQMVADDESGGLKQIITASAMSKTQSDDIVTIVIPDDEAIRKKVTKTLSECSPVSAGSSVSFSKSAYINHHVKTFGFPILYMDGDDLILGINGNLKSVAKPPEKAEEVNDALAQVERYIEIMDCPPNIVRPGAKQCMYEAILYFLFAPFASAYMQRLIDVRGVLSDKGPRFLCLYGHTNNGKTTLLKFGLSLILGMAAKPQSRDNLGKDSLYALIETGTMFPAVFDDIGYIHLYEASLKSYWETWWKPGMTAPQIIVTTNHYIAQPWAQTRFIRLNFNVHMVASNAELRSELASIIGSPKRLFEWFSFLYIKQMRELVPENDELVLARKVLLQLYEFAGRDLPDFFPSAPFAEVFDDGADEWHDLLYVRHVAKIKRRDDSRMVIEVGLDDKDINRYLAMLPPRMAARNEGSEIIIENPEEFDKWCPKPKGFLSRLIPW